MVKAVVLASSLVALSSALPAKREAQPQILGDIVDAGTDAIGNVAGLAGDVVSGGVDATKDVLGALLSIPGDILGLGSYGYGDKKAKRQLLGGILNGVGNLVDDITDNDYGRYGYYGRGYRGYRGYRGWRGYRGYGSPYGYYGRDWDDDDDKKVKRTIIPDILGGVTSVVDDVLGLGYGYDDESDYGYGYDDKKKRQILGDIVDASTDAISNAASIGGDIIGNGVDAGKDILGALLSIPGNLLGFGSYGYDDKKAKRQLVGGILNTVGNVVDDVLGLGYGYDDDSDYGYGYDDKKAKRQIVTAAPIAAGVQGIAIPVGAPAIVEVDIDDEDDSDYGYDYGYKSKRQIIPDILGGVTSVVDDVLGLGYGYDDESDYGYGYDDKKAKRQLLGSIVDTVGDVADSLFGGYGYDSYGYGDDSDYGYGYDKRQIVDDIVEVDVDVDEDSDLYKRQILSGLLDGLFSGFGSWGADSDDTPDLPEVEEIDVDVEPLDVPAPIAPAVGITAPVFQSTA